MATLARVNKQIHVLTEWGVKREKAGLSSIAIWKTIEILEDYAATLRPMQNTPSIGRGWKDDN